ncbi:MAG TPA: hypothetical protein VE197_22090 [Mycobacterium sp.]|nr:hypothetical protein [Mycobacterium sp.]
MPKTTFAVAAPEAGEQFGPGMRVDVRSRFVGTWSHGFEVAERVDGGYLVRRLSDGSVLAEPVGFDEVRPEHRNQGLWWA